MSRNQAWGRTWGNSGGSGIDRLRLSGLFLFILYSTTLTFKRIFWVLFLFISDLSSFLGLFIFGAYRVLHGTKVVRLMQFSFLSSNSFLG